MWITEAAAAAASAGGVKPAMFLRIAADPIIRAWSGVGDFRLSADTIETEDGAIYKGVGRLAEWPAFDVLFNGEAGRLSITMSGVDAALQDLAEDSAADIDQAACHLGVLFLDERDQPIAAPLWVVEGEMEDLETDRRAGLRTVTVTIGYGPLDRRRPLLGYWSPADQEARSPGDLFCSRTPLYAEGSEVTWPRW
ncbi:MAG: hypothetical protein KF842_06745 [Caulobacter sp.]|nr:hypothetical protein [Caulobacter sp.]